MYQFFGFTPLDSRVLFNEVDLRKNSILRIGCEVKSLYFLTGNT